MKTKLRRISKRSLAMLLSVLMMVSVLGIGTLITASATTATISFGAMKSDNGTTWSAGGGTLTATYTTGGGGGGSTPAGDTLYLWWGRSGAPSNYTNDVTMEQGSDGNYYATLPAAGEGSRQYYFVINDSSTSSLSGTLKINSSTTSSKDGTFNWADRITNSTYQIGRCETKYEHRDKPVYIQYDPTGDGSIRFQTTSFSYTPAGSGSGSGGGSGSSSGTIDSGGTVPYNSNVTFTADASYTANEETYQFIGWYSTAQPVEGETALSTTTTYTKNNVTSDVDVYARYKKSLYLTFYNSYVQDKTTGKFNFTAAPPRTVKVGMGTDVRATYTYKAGSSEQRGEEHIKNSTSDYYEGNKLLVLPGETVTLKFSTLASSDAIRGIFFNNDRRYTTETENNNLYYHREYKADGWGEYPNYVSGVAAGDVPDDDWKYDYAANTTIYADDNYYDGATAATIAANKSGYVGQSGMDQSTHTISWVASQSYLNIDIELDRKYQVHINDDEWEGLKIENMNDEGYYFGGETFADNFKISIDNTDVSDGTYEFTGTTATVTNKDGNAVPGVTVSPKQSGGSAATSTSDLSYFLVSGTMPRQNVYINIPAVKKYNMRLLNIVVSDNGDNKRTMLTETSGSETSSTGNIGTITAVPKTDGTPSEDISSDGTYYTYPSNNNSGEVSVYTTSNNNKYLKGGVNKNGSTVAAGSTVTYTFTFASGKDAEYTFVGWFEGDKNGDTFTPNYNKKLSGKTSFTLTPTKDTVVFAVGTRDIYLGGNFTSDGTYTTTDASKTWSSGRILMDFDPTYVNPKDSSQKGRYYYSFESVTENTEYQFRCYDTVSSSGDNSSFKDLSVWNAHINDIHGYNNGNNTDIADYRSKYDPGSGIDWTSHAGFMFTTAADKSFSEIKIDGTAQDAAYRAISQNHQDNGYGNPVTVYFYAYDSGVSVDSTYQWSKAYVSAGVGIDVKSVPGGTTTYNVPTVSVASNTVNNKDVTVTNETYGNEAIKNCLVKENNGQIVVTASPADANVELQAFLVYNIDTKKSEAVKTFTTSGSGVSKAYIGNITIPNNSKIYVVPIYKFTDAYITAQNLETHDVYVRADDIDKDDWGGLVSMYSWGTTSGYDSGGWPGQLMVPSDDGTSYMAPLTFKAGGLAGVTFNNYTKVWSGNYVNFLGLYQSRDVSDTVYSGYTNTNTKYIYQVFDYREPISIIENINTPEPKIYDSEDMTLTFALKPGNKTSGTVGNGAYNAGFNYEYLTDSSGKYRVDLNGNKLSTNSTASYYVVCNYTEAYKDNGTKSYAFAPSTHNRYSIDWNVYDINGIAVANGTQLSASFTDVDKDKMLTYIAKQLIDDGRPVSGKAVKIAYENPKVNSNKTEAVRYSGQWYADGINTIIEGNVRVGIYSDGAWLPSDSNAPGYGTATVEFAPDASKDEAYVTEDGCSGNSLARVTKIHAANGDVTFRVSTTDNFVGWYREDGKGGYEPIGSNYKNQSVSLSFNEDITYYAFYSASASYRVKYTGRDGSTKYFTAKGTDLTDAELAASGTLNASNRNSDITTKLTKAQSDIGVFNRDYTLALTNPTSTPYTLTYEAVQEDAEFTMTVYNYQGGDEPVQLGTVSGTFSTTVDLVNTAFAGLKEAGASPVSIGPASHSDYVFYGWKEYNPSSNTWGDEILSTHPNFGYSLYKADLTIAPYFGPASGKAAALGSGWRAGIDRNAITQELTSSTEGTIYNDSIVSFRYGPNTLEQIDPDADGVECGIVILAQTGTSSGDSTYGTNFNNISDSTVKSYAAYLKEHGNKGKMNSKFGEAYAYRIPVTSLSRLNRIDVFQALEYSLFSGGKYKIMSYYCNGNNDPVYSTVKSGTYTKGEK